MYAAENAHHFAAKSTKTVFLFHKPDAMQDIINRRVTIAGESAGGKKKKMVILVSRLCVTPK